MISGGLSINFRIDDKPIQALLNQLREDMRGPAMVGAMHAGLTPIETIMKTSAPVRKGLLRGCISRVVRTYQNGTLVFGAVGTDTLKLKAKGRPTNLGWLIEYGHRIVVGGRASEKKVGGDFKPQGGTGRVAGMTKPNPFMRFSFDAGKELAKTAILDFLARVVERRKG